MIIDSDYYSNPDNDGEIMFQLINLAPFDILLKAGDRIGQGIIKQYELVDGDRYNQGLARTGGFGSTSEIDLDNPFSGLTDKITTPYPVYYTTSIGEKQSKDYGVDQIPFGEYYNHG